MHLMPDRQTDTVLDTEPGWATFGPPRPVERKPRMDATLAEATGIARSAILDSVDAAEIGDHIGVVADDERVVTHRFAAKVRGYGGWEFFATLARAPRSKNATVCETGMLPGDDAILSPEWVPWMERASQEERIRLEAIAAGEDPSKALEEAGLTEPEVKHDTAESESSTSDSTETNKQARREAKRRRAKQQAARRKTQQKESDKDKDSKASSQHD